ncbi:MAG: STN domain-containing protein [Planctomycetota bacterium]|nr:STN domain-containing protein [Planctomycetota bacterium]
MACRDGNAQHTEHRKLGATRTRWSRAVARLVFLPHRVCRVGRARGGQRAAGSFVEDGDRVRTTTRLTGRHHLAFQSAASVPLQWPERSSPRQLIEQLAAEVELKIERPEQIPHDLWPAVALPPLDFAQRLSLLLAGLELTFEYSDAHAIRLLPLPATATVERSYAVSNQQTAAIQEITQRFPETRVTRRAGNVIVVAPLEAHELLQGLLHGRRPPGIKPAKPAKPTKSTKPTAKPEVSWTLRIENQTVVAVVKIVAKRLECQLACDPALLGKLNQRVSFEVNQVTLEKLLETALSPAGLTYRLDATTLRILPADASSEP